ncbi:MAG: PKD domain-containing protein [Bacteroidales bacterium]|jgi:gliding motility-associated-like protein
MNRVSKYYPLRYSTLAKFLFFAFVFLFSSAYLYASKSKRDTLRSTGPWVFIENKGQWDKNINFKSEVRGGAIFLENDCYTVVVEDISAINKLMEYKFNGELPENKENLNTIINCHSYKVFFENCNPSPKVKSFYPSFDYKNYYLGDDRSRWTSEVRSYGKVKYEELWNGIDLFVYSSDNKFKYDFVVAPDADVNQISLRYSGVDKISLSKGDLLISTSVGSIVEMKPYAYQIVHGEQKEVDCKFQLKNNILSFVLGKYDQSLELIIDPVLIFSTYTGSLADNWGYTATYDKNGFLYAGGSVFNVGYPTTAGAFQIDYGTGVCDISITKFDSAGTHLIYSTYLGGSGSEVPNSLIVNENDELYVLATTGSANFPTTLGCYDNSFNGGSNYTLTYIISFPNGSDIALCKFNSTGTQLLGSTFFGGSGNDGLNTIPVLKKNYADDVRGEVMIDEQSNVYVVSSTTSTDFPVTAGSFQTVYGGGDQDGCVFKFNHNLTNLIWSSYLGGAGEDGCYSIQLTSDNEMYIGGGTNSVNFPTTNGVLMPAHKGGVDGYITKINQNGTSVLASTYYGSSAYDQVYLVKSDRDNYIYAFGQTGASGTTFIQNAIWNKPGGGQFISKISPNLDEVVWSTAFGSSSNNSGQPDISPTALMVDLCNNIYMSGWGSPVLNGFGGTVGMPITADAFQTTTDNNDYYFLVIKDDASALVYGTYFGGPHSREHVDGGTCRFDKKGRIYQAMCAGCGGNNDLPVSPDAWSTTNNSFNCNLGALKFDFNLPAIIADFDMPDIVCAPAVINFQNNSQTIESGVTTWKWSFGDGATSTIHSPTHTYLESGTYDVTLIIQNLGSCNFADTITKQIIVLSNTLDTLPDRHLCIGSFIQIGIPPSGNPAISYNWTPGNGLNNTVISNPIANPSNTITYMLNVTDGVCIDTLLQTVHVYDLQVDAGSDIVVCLGDTAHLVANAVGGATHYYWSSNANYTDTINLNFTSNIFKKEVTETQTYYVHATNGYCSAYDSVTVSMSYADISAQTPYTICQGDSVKLSATNNISGQFINYNWEPASSVLAGGSGSSPWVNPTNTTTYTVTGVNNHGCKDTAKVTVNVNKVLSSNTVNNVICYGDCNGSVEVEAYGGSSPYSYSWSSSSTNTSNSINNLCAGVHYLTITDDIGCKKLDTFNIQQPSELLIAFADTQQVLCNGECTGEVRAVVHGGVPPYSYAWINGQTTDLITNLCAGTYHITVTDAHQCTATSFFKIMDTSSFDAVGSAIPVRCFGECNGVATVLATEGLPPYSYQWNIGADSTSFHNLCAGVYNVTVTDDNNCIRNVFINVPEPAPLSIDSVYEREPLCYGSDNGIIKIFVSGGTQPYSYTWNGIAGAYNNETLLAGTYEINITDARGCEIDTIITLSQPENLQVLVNTTKVPCEEVCIGEAYVSISGGTEPYYYLWSNGQNLVTEIGDLCKGNYSITVSDRNNCAAMAVFSIEDSSYFYTDVQAWSDRDTIYQSQSVQLESTEFDDFGYHWEPASSLDNNTIRNPIATPYETVIYTVNVIDDYGCILSDTVRIVVLEVICDEPYVYVPNAFTPDGDNKNDIVFVRSEIVTDVNFAIYDRWGEKVFETTDMNVGWDGTFRGRKLDPDVYVYYLNATCLNKEKLIKKGNITLIR